MFFLFVRACVRMCANETHYSRFISILISNLIRFIRKNHVLAVCVYFSTLNATRCFAIETQFSTDFNEKHKMVWQWLWNRPYRSKYRSVKFVCYIVNTATLNPSTFLPFAIYRSFRFGSINKTTNSSYLSVIKNYCLISI